MRGYDELANAITMFATDAARSIREANLIASSVSVFIETNRFGKGPYHAPSHSEALSPASNNTKHVVRAALTALKHIYREGLAYKRVGVMLLGLVEAGQAQGLTIRYARSKGRQTERGVRRHQRQVWAAIDPVRPCGAGVLLAIQQRVPLALLHNQVGRHPEGKNLNWTHPGKVEAPYTVCIASASNLTGLVKSSVECRRTGL